MFRRAFSIGARDCWCRGGSFDVGDPDDALPRDVGRNSDLCPCVVSSDADLGLAAAAACRVVIDGASGFGYASVLPRAMSPCSFRCGESSRGDLFGPCGEVECCRTVLGGGCDPFGVGCATGACNGGLEDARGVGTRASTSIPGGGVILCAVSCGRCRRAISFCPNQCGLLYP